MAVLVVLALGAVLLLEPMVNIPPGGPPWFWGVEGALPNMGGLAAPPNAGVGVPVMDDIGLKKSFESVIYVYSLTF